MRLGDEIGVSTPPHPPQKKLPAMGGVQIGVHRLGDPPFPRPSAFQLQVRSPHQLHPETHAAPPRRLRVPRQPLLPVLRARDGGFSSPSPPWGCPPSPPHKYLQVRLVGVPDPRRSPVVPRHQRQRRQTQRRVDVTLLRVHQHPHPPRRRVLGEEENVPSPVPHRPDGRVRATPWAARPRPAAPHPGHVVQAPQRDPQVPVLLRRQAGEGGVLRRAGFFGSVSPILGRGGAKRGGAAAPTSPPITAATRSSVSSGSGSANRRDTVSYRGGGTTTT